MIGRKATWESSPIFLILLTLGFFFATYNLVTLVIHNQNRVQGKEMVGARSADPVIQMPGELKKLAGPRRLFHVALMATDTPASRWQCRIMYYWYKKNKEMEGSEIGGFTRVLHSGNGNLDELMSEMPTFVANPLPAGMDRGHIVLNRPWAFVQWLEKAHIEEDYILMVEPDRVFASRLPILAKGDPAAFPFFIIKPSDNEKIIRKSYLEEKDHVTDIETIGNSPVIIKKAILAKMVNEATTNIPGWDDSRWQNRLKKIVKMVNEATTNIPDWDDSRWRQHLKKIVKMVNEATANILVWDYSRWLTFQTVSSFHQIQNPKENTYR